MQEGDDIELTPIQPASDMTIGKVINCEYPLTDWKYFYGCTRKQMQSIIGHHLSAELYGKDPKSTGWTPINPFPSNINEMYCYRPPLAVGFDVAKKVKFLLHYELYHLLRELTRYQSQLIPLALLHPEEASLEPLFINRIAIFRHFVLLRHCGSVRDFWEEYLREYQEVRSYGFDWDPSVPHMKLGQCLAMLQDENDIFGVIMAQILIETVGECEYGLFTKELNLTIYNNYLGQE